MTGLLASEFRRFRSRRLVKALVALELLAIVATGVIVFLTQEYALVGLPDVLMGTSLVLVSVLGSLFPAVTVVLARFVLDERIGRVQAAGLVLALAAVAMIVAG